ncbi:hypothetical protein [Leptospira noguchii]|uniref:hypothetical protein n=1 Tax=Leptospira noguchii TaxID=28182 RepID=UPI0015EFDA17|nr:hypothetical protein [Leptospira noguchii]UOG52286.1 hypothetical protein MAL09_17080 [Leptospira noguchii]
MPTLREAFAEFLGSRWKLSKTLPMGRVLGRSTGRVVESSSWYFMKIESDSVVSQ